MPCGSGCLIQEVNHRLEKLYPALGTSQLVNVRIHGQDGKLDFELVGQPIPEPVVTGELVKQRKLVF